MSRLLCLNATRQGAIGWVRSDHVGGPRFAEVLGGPSMSLSP